MMSNNLKTDYTKWQFTAFDANPYRVGCGRARLIVRTLENEYFTDTGSLSDIVSFDAETFHNLVVSQRVTAFDAPLDYMPGQIALFVSAAFMEVADFTVNEKVGWKPLRDGVWVVCATEEKVESQLLSWSSKLKAKVVDCLKQLHLLTYGASGVTSTRVLGRRLNVYDAKSLAPNAIALNEFALQASRINNLREEAYLRYALTLTLLSKSQQADRLYRLFIRKEFPSLTRQAYDEKLAQQWLKIDEAVRFQAHAPREHKAVSTPVSRPAEGFQWQPMALQGRR